MSLTFSSTDRAPVAGPGHARASVGSRAMPMSALGAPNRYPKFGFQFPPAPFHLHDNLSDQEKAGQFTDGRVGLLPYTPQENYDRAQALGVMPTVVLENEHMRATVYPRYGGRLASLFDKRAGRELLFDNPVFQPANLAIRNAWFSGGVEWNAPLFGHSLLTCSDVYVGRIATGQGDGLRIYEFDRSLETAWQVDLSLDETDPKLWIHVKLLNLNDHPVDFYWWTNIAAPQDETTRVFANDTGRAVRHAQTQQVYATDFPQAVKGDGSYPARYAYSDSVFPIQEDGAMPWIGCVDGGGQGLIHLSSGKLCGRKLFTWGAGTGGRQWSDFLARPGEGDYVELQAGLRPTQLQTLPVDPGGALEWTECITGLEMDPTRAHQADYRAARRGIEDTLLASKAAGALELRDGLMRDAACRPVVENLWRGSAWGALFEQVTGKPIAPGLCFDAPPGEGEAPWALLGAGVGGAGATSGGGLGDDAVVGDWMVSARWMDVVGREIDQGRGGWKHHLHMGVFHLENQNDSAARAAFERANEIRETDHAWRNLALIEVRAGQSTWAKAAYERAMVLAGPQIELALEYSHFLLEHDTTEATTAFLASLPEPIAGHERLEIVRAQLALRLGDVATVDRVLDAPLVTLRESETTLIDLWYAARCLEAGQRRGRELSDAEKKQLRSTLELPVAIDFRTTLEEV